MINTAAAERLFVVFLVAGLLSACTTVSEVREEHRQEDVAEELGCTFYQEGLASWYGEKFRGRKTASGERFNPDQLTAAHRNLPFGTKVRIMQKDGDFDKDGVEVRINDRGPFIKGRVIDVSAQAARKLGIKGAGVAPVRLYRCS